MPRFLLISLISIISLCCASEGEKEASIDFTNEVSDSLLLPYTAHIYDSELSQGYYFLFTFKMNKNNQLKKGYQQIIDGNGQTVYFRRTEKASDFKVHPCGLMSYFGTDKFMIMDSTFRIIDSVGCVNGIQTDNHDFLILPNGNYLLIGTESTDMNLSTYKIFMQKNLAGSKKAKVKYGVVQELNQKKELVYEWRAKPFFRMENAEQIYLNDSTSLDITHFNSIESCADGNFIISARYSNELIKVKKSDGSLIWRFGGKLNEFKFLNDKIPFIGQHDARVLKNGNILLFDNGYGREEIQHNARALEYKLDEQKKTATLVWSYSYEEKIVSEATGNARRSENGMTLMNFGKIKNGNPNMTFVMVDSKGKKAFDLSFADTVGTYRAYHYTDLPFQLKRPKVEVKQEKDSWILTAESGHDSYSWSDGSKTQSIRVKNSGKYYVFVPIGDGGFVSSEEIVVSE